ncbi:hypothetical protein N0V84_009551 [Fusarium piperis]|uniref:Uncharacterized protein n=1 Tax=Fusarium piperis TaxID=1435070 RepID=A0A9W8W654_9HYPO|nr:hypothetical protein N0V84_009551 [Fusarium piperis]
MNDLVLDAGEVNGVHVGDEYALYAFTALETSIGIRKESYIKARAVTVNHFTSKLCIDNCSEDQKVSKGSAWKAKMLTTLSPHLVRMMLIRGAPHARDLLDEAKKIPFLHLVLQDDQDRHDGSESDPRERAVFQVTTRDDCTYEVLDQRAEKVKNFPVINTSDPDAKEALLKALGHIAAFKFFERIENLNPDPRFEASFSLTCLNQAPGPDGTYKIKHNDPFKLHLKNLDMTPKYVAIVEGKVTA